MALQHIFMLEAFAKPNDEFLSIRWCPYCDKQSNARRSGESNGDEVSVATFAIGILRVEVCDARSGKPSRATWGVRGFFGGLGSAL